MYTYVRTMFITIDLSQGKIYLCIYFTVNRKIHNKGTKQQLHYID